MEIELEKLFEWIAGAIKVGYDSLLNGAPEAIAVTAMWAVCFGLRKLKVPRGPTTGIGVLLIAPMVFLLFTRPDQFTFEVWLKIYIKGMGLGFLGWVIYMIPFVSRFMDPKPPGRPPNQYDTGDTVMWRRKD